MNRLFYISLFLISSCTNNHFKLAYFEEISNCLQDDSYHFRIAKRGRYIFFFDKDKFENKKKFHEDSVPNDSMYMIIKCLPKNFPETLYYKSDTLEYLSVVFNDPSSGYTYYRKGKPGSPISPFCKEIEPNLYYRE